MSVLQRLGERFWFVPAVLCLLAAVLAEAAVAVDEQIGDPIVPPVVDLVVYRVGESGSRDILGAIASSALAVAGTTFSITMAVLALTSSSYGPRLVRNFMADRGNQMVLGVFTATFLYSLLVLRAIRAQGDPGDQDAEVFVPHLAVNGAVLLAVVNVGVLVYFIHHISDSIQIATITGRVREDLCAVVDRLYPQDLGRDRSDAPDGEVHLPPAAEGVRVTAGRAGYVSFVRDDKLMEEATDRDVLVVLLVRPGRYVLPDTTVALVHGDGGEDARAAVRSCLDVSDARTPYQDVEFAVQQLTEMAVRALSPGTNDPYTAVNALEDLSVGLSAMAARRLPSPGRFDRHGALRVHATPADLGTLLDHVVDSMRWYAADAPMVMHATLALVGRVAEHAQDPGTRDHALRQVPLLREAFGSAGHQSHDVRAFDRAADLLVAP